MQPTRTLLLVEDEPLIAIAEKSELEQYGYRVLTASSAEKAISIFRNHPEIDLVLMDINLGSGPDGPATAEALLSERDLPLVFLSSHTEPSIVQRTEQITSYGYVVKNTGITVLDASIKMAFRLFEANRRTDNQRKHLETILNSIEDAVIVVDTMNCITLCNPIAASLIGIAASDAIGGTIHSVLSLIDFKSRLPLTIPTDTALRKGKAVEPSDAMLLIGRSGQEARIAGAASPIRNADGTISGAVLVFRDVTAALTEQETLRINEERLRFALEGANDGLWDVDLRTDSVYMSPRGCEILGYRPDELSVIAKVWSELVHPDDLDITIERLQEYLSGRAPLFEVEQRLRTKWGDWKWIRSRGKAVERDAAGTPLRMTGTHTDISEQIKARQERNLLAERNLSVRQSMIETLERVSDAFVSLDANWRYTYMNRKAGEIFNRDPAEMIGRHIWTEFPEGIGQPFHQAYTRAMETQEVIRIDEYYPPYDRWFENRIYPSPDGLSIFFSDITEIKRKEQELKLSEERFRRAIENAPMPIAIYRNDGRLLHLSEGWTRYSGYTIEDIPDARTWASKAYPDRFEEMIERISELDSAQQTVHNGIHAVFTKDGCRRLWDFYTTPLGKTMDGHRLMLTNATDVTEREEMIHSLAEREDKYRLLTEYASDVIWVLNISKGAFTYISPSVIKLRGYTAEEAMNQSLEESLMPESIPVVQDAVASHLQEFLAKPTDPDFYYTEIRQPCKDGSIIWVEVSTKFRRNADGDVEILGVSRNIDDRKRTEEHIRLLLNEKDILLREVHHRIKNNLASIRSLLSLQLSATTAPDARSAFQDAIARIGSMLVLYDKLYRRVNYRSVSARDYFSPLVDEILQLFSFDASIEVSKHIDDVQLPADLIFPLGIILNELLTNSVKYAFTGIAHPVISVRLQRTGAALMLQYHDNGIGYNPEKAIDPEKGFGLTLVDMLTKQLQGTASIKSTEGFSFTLSCPIPGS